MSTLTVLITEGEKQYTLECSFSYAKGCKQTWEDPGWPSMVEDVSCECTNIDYEEGPEDVVSGQPETSQAGRRIGEIVFERNRLAICEELIVRHQADLEEARWGEE